MDDHFQTQDLCYLHPIQPLIGICAFCLNEKLLSLAAKQRRRNHRQKTEEDGVSRTSHSRKPSYIFSFGSLLNRLEFLHLHNRRGTFDCDEIDTHSTSTSLEDSFISMKLEDNGVALWDKSKVAKAEEGNNGERHRIRSVVEHTKGARGSSLRWRKRIGHLLQLVRWKRSTKSNGAASHVNVVSGIVKVRNRGWFRRRTSKESTQA